METTKFGTPITFERRLDVEGDKNRGWIVHTLIARVNGEEAGYLSVSYIPQDRFKAQYRSVLDYLRKIKGWCLPNEPHNQESLRCWVTRLGCYLNDNEAMGYDIDLDTQPEAWFTERRQRLETEATERFIRGFKEFEAYYVDKPIVDFIRVYRVHPSFGGDSRKHTNTSAPQDFQRQGIGTALYREASRWMRDLGLKLYASGCQTEEAQAVWVAFTNKGWVDTDTARLNGQKLMRQYLSAKALQDPSQKAA